MVDSGWAWCGPGGQPPAKTPAGVPRGTGAVLSSFSSTSRAQALAGCSRGAPPGHPLPPGHAAHFLHGGWTPATPAAPGPSCDTPSVRGGWARAATPLFLPCPSPALACSVWPAEPRNPIPFAACGKTHLASVSLGFRLSCVPWGRTGVCLGGEVDGGDVDGDGIDVSVIECSVDISTDVVLPWASLQRVASPVRPFGPFWGLSP